MNTFRPACQLIGAGRAGRALAMAMSRVGYHFTWIGSKHGKEACRLAKQIGVRNCGIGVEGLAGTAEFLIIAVPDDEIVRVASEALAAGVITHDTIAAHLSGALPSNILGDMRAVGAAVMAFHPSQTFTPESDPEMVFHTICFDIEGDDVACALGECIAQDLGATSIRLTPQQRILSHLAMTVASNYTVSIIHMAEEIMMSANIPGEVAQKMLLPLFLNTAHNIATFGTLTALTGPVSRGDDAIIRKHLSVLDSYEDTYKNVYTALGHIALRMAVKRGDVSGTKAEEIIKLLEK